MFSTKVVALVTASLAFAPSIYPVPDDSHVSNTNTVSKYAISPEHVQEPIFVPSNAIFVIEDTAPIAVVPAPEPEPEPEPVVVEPELEAPPEEKPDDDVNAVEADANVQSNTEKKSVEEHAYRAKEGDSLLAQEYALSLFASYGWDESEFTCLVALWNRESNWRWDAENPSSGAYGIPQSLPGDKMGSIADDWRTNYQTQVLWGTKYIADRYGSPCGAWEHSELKNWY